MSVGTRCHRFCWQGVIFVARKVRFFRLVPRLGRVGLPLAVVVVFRLGKRLFSVTSRVDDAHNDVHVSSRASFCSSQHLNESSTPRSGCYTAEMPEYDTTLHERKRTASASSYLSPDARINTPKSSALPKNSPPFYFLCPLQFHRDFRNTALLGLVQDRFPKSKLAYQAVKVMLDNSAPTERKVDEQVTVAIRCGCRLW